MTDYSESETAFLNVRLANIRILLAFVRDCDTDNAAAGFTARQFLARAVRSGAWALRPLDV